VEVFIKVMNSLGMTLEEDEIFMCLATLLCEQFLPIHEWRCQDIDQVILHGDHFSLSAFSGEVLGKNASIWSKLLTAAC